MNRPSLEAVVSAFLAVARSQLGKKEDPKKKNSGPEVDAYLKATGLGPGYSWCLAFVCWCAAETSKKLGIPRLFKFSASALRFWELNGSLQVSKTETPRPGDVAIFDHGSGRGHGDIVEFLVEVDGVPTGFGAIDGNSNSNGGREGIEVCRTVRSLSDPQLIGFIRFAAGVS